jgi:two-component system chemotaxis response regulator CheB
MIRVLIVDDSPTVALLLRAILNADPEITVVATARSGEEGVRMTLSLNPDLVTMDVHLPGIDGYEATRRIMATRPTPIVIVTASFEPDQIQRSFQALEAGALAVVRKPVGPGHAGFHAAGEELVKMVKTMATVKVVGQRTGRRSTFAPSQAVNPPAGAVDVVAIGASTGGPAALATVLGGVPANCPVPMLIVQHISAGFDAGLVEWLSTVTQHKVALAQDGQSLAPGQVLVAPQGKHMGVSMSRRIRLDGESAAIGAFRPSVTYLFSSLAKSYGSRAVGVILTGMGNDGSAGLVELHKAGGYVLAQDEASCVVYGMPGAAVAAGVVDRILPLNRIAEALFALLEKEEDHDGR